jgi:Uma2 family endonuclease
MSTIGNALTTWEEFLQLPDDLEGNRYERQDGEVVAVPPPELDHVFTQRELCSKKRDRVRQ